MNVFENRKNMTFQPTEFGDKHDKILLDHIARYEKSNSPVEALCHESLGCILFEMGLNDEAMVHANASKRIAQGCLKNAEGKDTDRVKLTLACALALKGRVENATGLPDDAKSDLEESVKLRKQLPVQHEENLAKTMADLALAYLSQSESRMAERTIEEGMKLVEGSPKQSHQLATAKLRKALAEVRMRNGHHLKAEELLAESLKIEEELLQPGHPEIAKTFLAMANLKEAQGRKRDASGHRQKASAMLTKCFSAVS